MKFHTPVMCLLNHKFQRIIKWFRRLTLPTRQPFRPRLFTFCIKCISRCSDLNEYCIYPCILMKIQQFSELLLLLIRRQISAAWPVNIGYSGYPDSSEFIFWWDNFLLLWVLRMACSEQIMKKNS